MSEQLFTEERASPSKGWVRDGVLSYLARRPGTATDIARALGVSKATISYHTKALIRRDMIEIADIKSIRGGVYSKTYALKQGSLALVRRKDDQTDSLTKLDERFERLLMNMRLGPSRKPADEMELFLYHLFRLLAESDSLDERIFEDYGRRVGDGLISPALRFTTLRSGLKELTDYLASEGFAEVSASLRKGQEAKLVCAGCFENKEHGSLVCSFTKGMLTGAIKARDGGTLRLDRLRSEPGTPACVFAVKRRSFTS
ncbi:MAG TPA: ArsR family transcriptional regulator [Nitrososphaerales archaeon]|nr:ArsR family transcriptional regulator [Nitrososphaerales archaeon]